MTGKHGKDAYTQPELLAWLNPRVRTWLYGILTCVVPLLIAYGVLDEATAALWVALGGAVLGLGTAYFHTPAKEPFMPGDETEVEAG